MAKKKRRRRAGLAHVSLSDLQREIQRRAGELDRLASERDQLQSRVDELDEQIRVLNEVSGGGAVGHGAARGRRKASAVRKKAGRPSGKTTGRKRPKNEMSLAEALAKVLKNRTMGVTEVTEAVQKAGYKTNAANFRTIVNQTLIRDDRFKKVSRGQYTAK